MKDPRGIADILVALEEVKRATGHVEVMVENNNGDIEEFEVAEVIDRAILELKAGRAR